MAPRRLLVLSIEFLGPVFSGNGQYCRSIVRGLKAAGAEVLVVSGRRADVPLEAQDAEARAHAQPPHGVVGVPLARWGALDAGCDWEGFAAGAGAPAAVARVAAFAPHAVLCVDWHGWLAWRRLATAAAAGGLAALASLPSLYLNFRVFATSFPAGQPFYRCVEAAAVRGCAATVALCRADAVGLCALALGRDPGTGAALDGAYRTPAEAAADATGGATLSGTFGVAESSADAGAAAGRLRLPDVRLLLPPLRSDIARLASGGNSNSSDGGKGDGAAAQPGAAGRRRYLTSVVRLSPEKGPHRFVELVAALAPTLAELGVVPFMAAAPGGDPAYAAPLVDALRAATPQAEVATAFMGPADMGRVYAGSLLVVHPALADAYGMTLVEAAAFGAPSLVHVPAGVALPAAAATAAGGRDGDDAAAAVAPIVTFSAGSAAIASAGYLRMHWRPDAASLPTGDLSAQLAAQRFPPVGACDLLMHQQPPPAGTTAAAAPAPAVVAVDFTAPVERTAATVAALLREAVAADDDAAATSSRLAAAGAAAQRVSLSWLEPDTATALLAIVSDVLGA